MAVPIAKAMNERQMPATLLPSRSGGRSVRPWSNRTAEVLPQHVWTCRIDHQAVRKPALQPITRLREVQKNCRKGAPTAPIHHETTARNKTKNRIQHSQPHAEYASDDRQPPPLERVDERVRSASRSNSISKPQWDARRFDAEAKEKGYKDERCKDHEETQGQKQASNGVVPRAAAICCAIKGIICQPSSPFSFLREGSSCCATASASLPIRWTIGSSLPCRTANQTTTDLSQEEERL